MLTSTVNYLFKFSDNFETTMDHDGFQRKIIIINGPSFSPLKCSVVIDQAKIFMEILDRCNQSILAPESSKQKITGR